MHGPTKPFRRRSISSGGPTPCVVSQLKVTVRSPFVAGDVLDVNRLQRAAQRALGDYLDWVRVATGQEVRSNIRGPYRGSASQALRFVDGVQVEESAFLHGSPRVKRVPPLPVLNLELAEKLATHCGAGQIDEYWELLTMAEEDQHALRYNVCVLLAAMSVEIATKRTLAKCASPDQQALLETLVGSKANVSVHNLFKDGLGWLGVSTEIEDKAALKARNRDVQHLMELRNEVVHANRVVDPFEAQDAVKTARRSVTWLADHPGTP